MNATAAEHIWLSSYPAGVPAEIDADRYSSIADIFNQACHKYRDLAAFTCMGKTLTYGDLDEKTAAFASYLQVVLKLEKGDRVAVMMPNILQYPVAIFGILRAGFTVVNVNPPHNAGDYNAGRRFSGLPEITAGKLCCKA